MSKEPNNIDRLIREKLEGFEMNPPPSVWENTSSSIVSGIRNKGFFLLFGLIFAVLTILGVGAYYLSSEKTSSDELALKNPTEQASNLIKNNDRDKKDRESTMNLSDANDEFSSKSKVDLKDEKAVNSRQKSSDEQLNSKRNFSSINSYMGREKSNHKKGLGSSDSQTQNDDSMTNNGSDALSSADQLSDDNSDSHIDSENPSASNFDLDATAIDDAGNLGLDGGNVQYDRDVGDKSTELNSTPENKLRDFELIHSLPTSPIEFFTFKSPELGSNDFQTGKPSFPNPFWKAFSLEGSIGVSTFANKAVKNSTDPALVSLLDNSSSNRNSLDLNFGLNYHLNSRVSFQTGLEYSKSQEDYTYNTIETTTFQYTDSIATSFDSLTGDSIYTMITIVDSNQVAVVQNQKNLYKTLSIPFHFAWTQSIGVRSKLEFALGGALSIYSENTGSVLLDTNGLISSEQAYHKKGVLSLGGSIRYLYYFGNHHAVYVQPWAQFGITNQSTPALNYESLRRKYGIRVGYRFHL